jgi:beta-N-acetylglucosaminidase
LNVKKFISNRIGYSIAGGVILALLTTSHASAVESKPLYEPSPSKYVAYNWGFGSPASNFPVDGFEAKFNQSGYYSGGDYFVQAFADDGVMVTADGNKLIDRWGSNTGKTDRALWLGVQSGNHTVTTDYREGSYSAAVFSHALPLDTWLAYYYPNRNLSGMPTAAKVISPLGDFKKLYQDFGNGSPASGIPSDQFSARYTTAKRITAGEYILRGRADDGIRVYVDGKLVVDEWNNGSFRESAVKLSISDRSGVPDNEKNIHWIEVEYYDSAYSGKVDFFLEPFANSYNNTWVGEIYPNTSFSGDATILGGTHAQSKITNLAFNWKTGSPASNIPVNNFSARFTKEVNLTAGHYLFTANGDDAFRVYLDGKLVLNSWPNSDFKDKKTAVYIGSGKHKLVVEYSEYSAAAHVSFDYQRLTSMGSRSMRNVEYNWGSGSPTKGVPSDNFIAEFNQSGSFSAGDYFVQTLADDGIRLEADGKTIIDRWNKFSGSVDRGLWLGVTEGKHSVKTRYFEASYDAGVFSHIVPLNTWLAYYYPNTSLSGFPKAAKILSPTGGLNKLYEDHRTGSPASGIPADNFSARYTSAQRIQAGEYVLRARADDAVRVYLDGKLVLDQWSNGGFREKAIKLKVNNRENVSSNEKDIHWVEVHYYDKSSAGKVEVFFEPFSSAINNYWVGEFYSNVNFQGNPQVVGGNRSLNKLAKVGFNSGNKAPYSFLPVDNFSARYTKRVHLDTGTYLFNANADDAVRVYLNNQLIIDAWPNSGNKLKQKSVYVSSGTYTIRVEYYEKTYASNLSFDYQKVSSIKVFYEASDQISYNWGNGGPEGFGVDNFKALFDQSRYFNAGDYFIQTYADDGVKVQVDGKWLIDRYTKFTGSVDRGLWLGVNAGEHTIKTHYYEGGYSAGVFSHIVPFDSWLAYYYPNETLTGMPTASKIVAPVGVNKNLKVDFGNQGPATGIDSDHFSARFTSAKRLKAGDYTLRTNADDGIRVYVDGVLVLDRWSKAIGEESIRLPISDRSDAPAGQRDIHWVVVEYREGTYSANIDISFELNGTIELVSNYNYSLIEMLNIQMSVGPKTDLHTKYVREDALVKTSDGKWVVNGSGWHVRSGPGTSYPIVGTVGPETGEVTILKTVSYKGELSWYQISAWINPLRVDVEKYVNPDNIAKGTAQYFQFLKLSERAGLNVTEVNQKILSDKGILQGKGSSFVNAGSTYGINEVYLISHALLETGNGTSKLATGVVVSSVDGKAVTPKTVYNMYGIGAKDSCPLQCGSEYAYKMGWTTPEKAIIGGAKFIAEGYISRGQDTIYKMRWNPDAPGTHQYASDIGWASKQVTRINSLYGLLSEYTLVFDVPKYQ